MQAVISHQIWREGADLGLPKKLDPFSFEHNFCKYCQILIILSLLQTEINYDQAYPKTYHHTQMC